jgi:hypothetical protein
MSLSVSPQLLSFTARWDHGSRLDVARDDEHRTVPQLRELITVEQACLPILAELSSQHRQAKQDDLFQPVTEHSRRRASTMQFAHINQEHRVSDVSTFE